MGKQDRHASNAWAAALRLQLMPCMRSTPSLPSSMRRCRCKCPPPPGTPALLHSIEHLSPACMHECYCHPQLRLSCALSYDWGRWCALPTCIHGGGQGACSKDSRRRQALLSEPHCTAQGTPSRRGHCQFTPGTGPRGCLDVAQWAPLPGWMTHCSHSLLPAASEELSLGSPHPCNTLLSSEVSLARQHLRAARDQRSPPSSLQPCVGIWDTLLNQARPQHSTAQHGKPAPE